MKMETTYQSSWDAAKAAPSGRFIAINIYTNEIERSQINNLTLHDYISWLRVSYSWDARKLWRMHIINRIYHNIRMKEISYDHLNR